MHARSPSYHRSDSLSLVRTIRWLLYVSTPATPHGSPSPPLPLSPAPTLSSCSAAWCEQVAQSLAIYHTTPAHCQRSYARRHPHSVHFFAPLRMSAVSLTGFGSRLLAELRVRRSLNDTLFRRLCRSLLPVALQARHDEDEPILDMADDKDAADGRLLELYTGILLQCQGHTVSSVGGAKGDGGVDVMVQSAMAGSGSAVTSESGPVIVQCKQYRDTPVNVDVLVQLLGAMDVQGVRHGLLVTSSEVTEGVSQLERHLEQRFSRWQRNGRCKSCGDQQRPLRAQVWDRHKLVALFDQHAAAFVQLRESLIQRLLNDTQLMRIVRQRRGTDYCVRHAICDPHTFPHNECSFGCRPIDPPVVAVAACAAAASPRKALDKSRPLRRKHAYQFLLPKWPTRQTATEPMAQPSQTEPATDVALMHASKTTSSPFLASTQQAALPPHAGSVHASTLTARTLPSPQRTVQLVVHSEPIKDVADEQREEAQRWEQSDDSDETDEDLSCWGTKHDSEDGRDGYYTPSEADSDTEADNQPKRRSGEEQANTHNNSEHGVSSQGTALKDAVAVDQEQSPDVSTTSVASTQPRSAPLPAGSRLHDPFTQLSERRQSPDGRCITDRRRSTSGNSARTQYTPPRRRSNSGSGRSAFRSLVHSTPTGQRISRQLILSSPKGVDGATGGALSAVEERAAAVDSGATSTICEGENGELFLAAPWDDCDETALESVSDDEVTIGRPSPVAPPPHCSSPLQYDMAAHSVHYADRSVTASPRPIRTARPTRSISAPRIAASRPVMTGEQERQIAERIDDERCMEMDEIDSMLQLILTRPAPYHHIQLPAVRAAAANMQPQPQPQPPLHVHERSEGEVQSDDLDDEEGEADPIATTASEEQEEEEEQEEAMDALSSDDEAGADQHPISTTIQTIKHPSHLPPTPTRPLIHYTSPPRSLARDRPIIMRPKRTPRLAKPSVAQPCKEDKVPFTDREVRELILLYRQYGGDARRFASILDDPTCQWLHTDKPGGRNNVGLKDKWRNLTGLSTTKCDVLTVMCSRIEREAKQQRLEKGIKEGKLATKRRVKECGAG